MISKGSSFICSDGQPFKTLCEAKAHEIVFLIQKRSNRTLGTVEEHETERVAKVLADLGEEVASILLQTEGTV